MRCFLCFFSIEAVTVCLLSNLSEEGPGIEVSEIFFSTIVADFSLAFAERNRIFYVATVNKTPTRRNNNRTLEGRWSCGSAEPTDSQLSMVSYVCPSNQQV